MSIKNSLNLADIKSRCINVALFFGPVILYVLTQLSTNAPIDFAAIKLIAVGLVLNLFKKFLQDNGQDTTPTE